MFEKTSQLTKATLAALWLTISGASGAHAQEAQSDQDRPRTEAPVPDTDNADRQAVDGVLSQGQTSDMEEFVAQNQCDPELVETLVSRDVYEEVLSPRFTTRGARPEDPDGENLQADMAAFRADRQEKISYFFDCSVDNINLHAMAKRLQDDPQDRDAFERIFAEMVTERADDIASLYAHEEQAAIADNLLSLFEAQNSEYIDNLGFFYNGEAMREQVEERLLAEHGRIAILAAHADMIDVLDLETVIPPQERTAYRRTLTGIVENEFRSYVAEAGRRYNQSAGQGYDI